MILSHLVNHHTNNAYYREADEHRIWTQHVRLWQWY